MADPAFRSLAELGRGLREGAFSAREITALYLGRIERAEPRLNAFVEVYREGALAQAEAADALLRAGVDLGPLHGLPIALKDLIEWQGRGCGAGSKSWERRRSATTATVLRRLLAAGAVVLGRAHMVEFAFGGWGTNPLLGTPWNPWDLTTQRIPGGSSNGSGVAVGAGLAPAALGSDTGGSVRIPASVASIVGLKPTYGRISLAGCVPLSWSLDSIGPMTRTVEDAAILLGALAGPDPEDPATAGLPAFDADAWRRLPVAGRRIAVMDEADFPLAVEPACLAAFREAQAALRELGVSVETVRLPFRFDDLVERNGLIIAAEAYAFHGETIADPARPIGEAVRGRILRGRSIPAPDYIAALRGRSEEIARFGELMRPYDALLTPTLPCAPVRLSEVDEARAPLAAFTRPANYLEACAISLPGGFDAAGLPVGIQLMAPGMGEDRLLAMAAALEAATGHGARAPDLSPLGL
ncbi:amidase [Marinimicrococcus flavescens]|uniref:Amidase n=1 Tax=Marinimicrococcus flavescens TaxID=3031815 RepID=A0AAP3V1C9_9PROT|nr:amidase [Marinimicrococcus flavescens]